ncbi:MAG: HAD family hydrolase [Phycisphaerales bacterium]|nr:HAD family hydrolase [Phycisphaerales bacterium]
MAGRRKYKAVLVDFYGTIADGDAFAVESVCRQLVGELSLPLSPAELAVAWGERFFETIERRNHHDFRTLLECECESLMDLLSPLVGWVDPAPYVERLKDYWTAPPIHAEAVGALTAIQMPICCVSNADNTPLRRAIETNRLRFDHVITSEDARCYKPEPHIFMRALNAVGLGPDEVLHVGDSLHSDIGGAKRAGIDSAWVCRNGRIHDIGQDRATFKINDLNGLHSIIG